MRVDRQQKDKRADHNTLYPYRDEVIETYGTLCSERPLTVVTCRARPYTAGNANLEMRTSDYHFQTEKTA